MGSVGEGSVGAKANAQMTARVARVEMSERNEAACATSQL